MRAMLPSFQNKSQVKESCEGSDRWNDQNQFTCLTSCQPLNRENVCGFFKQVKENFVKTAENRQESLRKPEKD